MVKEKVVKSVEKTTETINVDKAEFIRTRDAFVTSWMQLNGAIEHAIKAYITHTNSVLGGTDALTTENLNVLNSLMAATHGATPDAKEEDEPKEKGKKKKVTKPKDPNAPRRPLTAYLLYLEEKRPEIQKDLGEGQKRGDISAEGTRRWHLLDETQQQVYKDRYKASYQGYLAEARKYKIANGELPADAEIDDAAVAEGATLPDDEEEVDDDKSSVVSDTTADEPAKEPTPPPPPAVKTPKGGRANRKTAKTADDAAAPASSPVKSNKKPKAEQAFTSVNAAEKGTPASRKRNSDAVNKAETATEAAATAAAAPKAKKTKKETAAEKAAAATTEEASSEAPKVEKKERKKRKSEA